METTEALTVTELVAGEVRAHLARRGLRQRHLAEVLDLSVQSTNMRLRGKTPFDVNELGVIADFFGVRMVDLLPGPTRTVGQLGVRAGAAMPSAIISDVAPALGLEPRTCRWAARLTRPGEQGPDSSQRVTLSLVPTQEAA